MNIEENIVDFLKKQDRVTIGFSLGKDSLACAIILREIKVKFIPFYFYHIPDLDFVNEQIKMYESILGVNIIKLPHPMLYDTLRHQDYQIRETANHLASIDFPKMTFQNLINAYLFDNNIKPCFDVVGMRASESYNRRMFFRKNNPISIQKLKVYPIYNWKNQDVFDFLKSHNVPVTDDYKIWNRSWDGIKYQFLIGVKKHYPNDYIKIKQYLPLIDLEIKRYEYNLEYHKKNKN